MFSTQQQTTGMIANKWCVYGHYVDGELIYIGMGDRHRPYDKTGHLNDWHSKTKGDYQVGIYGWYETKDLAREAERLLIKEHAPVCNSKHTGRSGSWGNTWNKGRKHSEETRSKAMVKIRCLETGVIYPSAAEAAAAVNRHKTSISFVVNGRSGGRVGGFTFEKVVV